MSLTTGTRIAVAAVVLAATGVAGYAVFGTENLSAAPTEDGTVMTAPMAEVSFVPVTSPSHAAIAVSNRLFVRSDVVVLTSDEDDTRGPAMAAAKRLRVPILLDDPAVVSELTRLGANTVLTFGKVQPVHGAQPITGTSEQQVNQEIAEAVGDDLDAEPDTVEVFVLMPSAQEYSVATASAEAAGAQVLDVEGSDVRDADSAVTDLLAEKPEVPVLAIGPDYNETTTFTASSIRSGAEQIRGGYLLFDDRALIGLHGNGDQGSLGRRGVEDGLALLRSVGRAHRENSGHTVVGLLQVFGDEAAVNEAIAAGGEDFYTAIGLTPAAGSSLVDQARRFEEALTKPFVGISVDLTASGIEADEVNQLASWLADLTATHNLPQKPLLLQVSDGASFDDLSEIDVSHPELALVAQLTVAGDPVTNLALWTTLQDALPGGMFTGWTNYEADGIAMLDIPETWSLVVPQPDVVMYR